MSEDQLQSICYTWAVNTYKELRFGNLFAIPNGGLRNKIEAQKFKATGVVAGIPDMILLNKGKMIGIELKTLVGVVSDKQKKVHESWKEQGFEVYIIRTFEEFQELIKKVVL